MAVGFLQLLPAAKRTRKETLLGGATIHINVAEQIAEGFGPLKVVLGSIPAVYANSKVRL